MSDTPLAELLDAQRERSRAAMGDQRFAEVTAAIEQLRASGVAARAPAVGTAAPDFELPDLHGETFRLGDLLGRRAVVLAFYRGSW